ncbi:MAG: hypothetical protein R2828_16535 [Saprospiraceae bacterium]
MGLELAWGLLRLLLHFRLSTYNSPTSALDLRLLSFMLALPMLNPDGIGIGLGFAWAIAAFPTYNSPTSALDLPTSLLHAGSTNVESRWDWNWLGVCLGYCCFPTFDLQQPHLRPRLTTSLLHAGSANVESRWDWNWLGVCLGYCCFPTFDLQQPHLRPRLSTSLLHAGSTNVESRWDWNWLGVCLGYCCISDFRLLSFMLALPMLNPDGIGIGLGFAWAIAAFRPRLTTSAYKLISTL